MLGKGLTKGSSLPRFLLQAFHVAEASVTEALLTLQAAGQADKAAPSRAESLPAEEVERLRRQVCEAEEVSRDRSRLLKLRLA